MSKLIFPKYGGVLVPDETKVVRTVRHRTRSGEYIIKIVEYPTTHRPYSYHFLRPNHETVGSTSGRSYEIDDALKLALKCIRENEKNEKASRRQRSQHNIDKLNQQINFFLTYATPNDLKTAAKLARAEKFATDSGWTVEWIQDPEEYQLGDSEEPPREVLCAVLHDSSGNVLTSLGGIADPDKNYARVIEAELALDKMPQ